MNPPLVIGARRLGKEYRIGGKPVGYRSLRDAIAEIFQKRVPSVSTRFWALRDVSFDVFAGEVVGVIGRNGAGKSTLLKILSRITEPTEGTAEIHGRVGSLLEVGTGFHPELSGRENIALNAAILGMRRHEVTRVFDDIVAFAEVERFLDTPVKHYSSGMHMRLAFAVAAHLQPEILIVDEVLAVGDAAFQRKCLGKMGDVARAGRTVFFVSHNIPAVQALCTRAIWLDHGRVVADGEVAPTVSDYLKSSSNAPAATMVWNSPSDAPGTDAIRLRSIRIRPDQLDVNQSFEIDIEYWNLEPGFRLNLSMSLLNGEDVCVFATTSMTDSAWHGKPFPSALFRSSCSVPGRLLNEGGYRVRLLFVRDAAHIVAHFENILGFEVADVADDRDGWHGRWPGVVRPRLKWLTERIEETRQEGST